MVQCPVSLMNFLVTEPTQRGQVGLISDCLIFAATHSAGDDVVLVKPSIGAADFTLWFHNYLKSLYHFKQ